MDLDLSQEQVILAKSARDFLNDKCPKSLVRAMETDARGYSPQLWQEMASLGWMGLAFPEEYGGSGMRFLDLAVLLEEMGRACLPGPFLSTVVMGGMTILGMGNAAQKQDYLPRIASGNAIFTLALTEASAKYDAASVTVKATKAKDAYIIDGTKMFVPDAHIADYLLCVARTGPAASVDDTAIFVVDMKTPGITCKAFNTMAGDKLSEVTFSRVGVPQSCLLGKLNDGGSEVSRIVERGAVAHCCRTVGILQRMLEMSVDYVKTRMRFDRPIGSFQPVQHECARMAIDINGARISTYQAAWRLGEGLPCRREVAIAKAWTGETCERAIANAHQVHGAIGLTTDYDLQLYSRRAKALQASFGDADFCREVVAAETGL